MTDPTVFVVDDDAAVRDSLALLCEAAHLAVECHDSAESFLAAFDPERPGCLVLDMHMPGMGGQGLQRELAQRGVRLPVLFLTAHGDIPTAVGAIKAGAEDFLTKPVDGALLVERIQALLARQSRERERLAVLTGREREVMRLAVSGRSNKEIGRLLGISHRTVELHRSHILHKTGAASLLELARLAEPVLPEQPPPDSSS